MQLSVVIPAYDEVLNIPYTINEILEVLKKMKFEANYEIIVVDDHSTDDTFLKVSELRNPQIKCMRLSKRSGSHIALRAGIKSAKGDYVLIFSADGQHDPACLPEMIEKLRIGANVVWAYRKNRKNELWVLRKFAELFYKTLIWMGGVENKAIDMSRADFFMIDKKVIDAINSFDEQHIAIFGLIVWVGFKHDFIVYERRLRRSGKSKWSFKRRLSIAMDWILSFSGLPLKLMIVVGTMFALFSFIYGIIVIVNALVGRPIQGWSSLMVVLLLIGGIQMIMFGIMGEYIWRNLQESRKRRLYFIESSTEQVS